MISASCNWQTSNGLDLCSPGFKDIFEKAYNQAKQFPEFFPWTQTTACTLLIPKVRRRNPASSGR